MEGRLVLSLVPVSSSDALINSTASVGQTGPSVAMDPSGDYVVAWSQQYSPESAFNYEVDAKIYNSAGVAQGATIKVASANEFAEPSVAMDANGNFVVAWIVLNTSNYYTEIQAQRFNAGARRRGARSPSAATLVKAPQAEDPKVAMDSAGDFTIAWQGYDTTGADQSAGVFAQRFNSSGVAQGNALGVNTVTRRFPGRSGDRDECRW